MVNLKYAEIQQAFVWMCPEEVCGHHLNIVTDHNNKPVTNEGLIADFVACSVCHCRIPTGPSKPQSPSIPTDNQPTPPSTKQVPKNLDTIEIRLPDGELLATDSATVSNFSQNGLTDRLSIFWPSSNFSYEFQNVANRLIPDGKDRFGSFRFKLTLTSQEELLIRLHRLEFQADCSTPWQEGYR